MERKEREIVKLKANAKLGKISATYKELRTAEVSLSPPKRGRAGSWTYQGNAAIEWVTAVLR